MKVVLLLYCKRKGEKGKERKERVRGRYQSGHCLSHDSLDPDIGRRKIQSTVPEEDAGTGQLTQVVRDGMQSQTYHWNMYSVGRWDTLSGPAVAWS